MVVVVMVMRARRSGGRTAERGDGDGGEDQFPKHRSYSP
jgi:hypothetical protein